MADTSAKLFGTAEDPAAAELLLSLGLPPQPARANPVAAVIVVTIVCFVCIK
ncbi:MAG: hypothetical protein QF721_09010 [Verrucomicrobiota bacterium]|nr:hypothetical protein [Verrucomicrobiota bacterium]